MVQFVSPFVFHSKLDGTAQRAYFPCCMGIPPCIQNVASSQKGPAMKTVLTLLLLGSLASSAVAQTQPPTTPKHHHKKDPNAPGDTNAPAAQPDPSADQTKQVQEYQKTFVPTDPWRVMNEKTNFARGAEWVQFEGRVTQVTADGLVVQGWFGAPLCYLLPNNGDATTGNFLLSNYPRRMGVGQPFSRNDRLVAFKAGTKNEMPNLDYGSVYVPVLTEEQKTQVAQAKTKSDAKVLAWHQELADKGDAYGEYKMGMRYLNGDGVDKDVAKARDMLGKAAAQGNQDAAGELPKVPAGN
jgi:hypothetical protein